MIPLQVIIYSWLYISGIFPPTMTFISNFPLSTSRHIHISTSITRGGVTLELEVRSPVAGSVPWWRGAAWPGAGTAWWRCGEGPSPPASRQPARPSRRWERPRRPDTDWGQEQRGTWRHTEWKSPGEVLTEKGPGRSQSRCARITRRTQSV